MRKYVSDIGALACIVIAAMLFFWKFLFPVPQLLVTPDYGRSDAWHFSFPTKYFLSQSLKNNELPLWASNLGGGFPLFAEGQTGALFLPNVVLFKILDPVIAYNISLLLIPITIGWGMYLWLRLMKLGSLTSLFGAVTLAFSGLVIAQLHHITLLQGFSLLPWIMAATHKLLEKKSFLWIAILAILISQQIFAGFPQASFITMLFAGGYFLYLSLCHSRAGGNPSLITRLPTMDPDVRRDDKTTQIILLNIFRFSIAVFLGLGLSAIQLLPSFEFLNQSTARGGFSPADAAYFSYPFKHLITFLDPFRLGNPKLGTYPPFFSFDGSIFWENTGYIGILPFVFIAVTLFSLKRQGLTRVTLFFLMAVFFSFFLMTGSHSPTYIIYSFWPFNLFRVPSRFLWVFVISLVILASIGVQKLQHSLKRRGLTGVALFLIVGFQTISLIQIWKGYHALEPANQWLSEPSSLAGMKPTDRVYTIGSELTHNQTFLTTGWQDMSPYVRLREQITPDTNLLWNVTSIQVYAGRFLRRQALTESLLSSLISFDITGATVSAQAQKFLDVFGVTKIFSPLPLTRPETAHLPRAYIATDPIVAQTFEDAARKMQNASFVPGKNVILEKTVTTAQNTSTERGSAILVTQKNDREVTITVSDNPAEALLVLNDTFYPGWRGFIDGKPVEIFPANIRFRAVMVPKGDHTIVFRYEPESVLIGGLVSAVSGILIGGAFLLSFATVHIHEKTLVRVRHRLNNRGT